jgi:hypothetical protein
MIGPSVHNAVAKPAIVPSVHDAVVKPAIGPSVHATHSPTISALPSTEEADECWAMSEPVRYRPTVEQLPDQNQQKIRVPVRDRDVTNMQPCEQRRTVKNGCA